MRLSDWLARWKKIWSVRPALRAMDAPRRGPLGVEQLEDRSVPSVYIVQSSVDTSGLTPTSGDGTAGNPFLIASLRSAVEQANASVGADTILFAAGLAGQTIYLVGGQISISDALTITGPGAKQLTVSGSNSSRLFHVDDGDAGTNTEITLDGLRLTGGNAASGGAVFNTEILTVQNCAVSGNSATSGGAFYNSRTLQIKSSIISGNTAVGGNGGGLESGSGIAIVENSTVTGNSATGNGGGLNVDGGSLTVINCTVSGNSAVSGGGVNASGNALFIRNSVVSGNSAAGGTEIRQQYGSFSGSHNLLGHSGLTNTQAFVGTVLNPDPTTIKATSDGDTPLPLTALISPLADNGGPTMTYALPAGSPAINKGDNSIATGFNADQRGAPHNRVIGDNVDIGAFEADGTARFTAASSTVATNAGTFTVGISVQVNGQDVSVPFSVTGGTAVAGLDYAGTGPSPVVVAAGQATGTATGTLIDNYVYATGGRTLVLSLGTPTNAVVAAPTTHTLTISPTTVRPAYPSLTTQQRFVQAVYLNELGRAGSPAELNAWVGVLNSGPSGASQVVNGITKSLEAASRLVKTWYRLYLGRDAGGGEEVGWARLLQSGNTEERVLGRILASSEFYQRAQTLAGGGTADDRYVRALYRVLLGRTGGTGETAGWVTQISRVGRSGVAEQILWSSEFRTVLFTSYYNHLLHRPPETYSLPGWVATSLSAYDVRLAIESSQEFVALG